MKQFLTIFSFLFAVDSAALAPNFLITKVSCTKDDACDQIVKSTNPCVIKAYCRIPMKKTSGVCIAQLKNCDDKKSSTGDSCNAATGTCVNLPLACDVVTITQCTVNQCNPLSNLCSSTPINEDGVCDDGDPCTVADSCTLGTCVGTPMACNAPPTPTCTSEGLLRTFNSTGLCGQGVCSYAFVDSVCTTPQNGTGFCKDGNCTYDCVQGFKTCESGCCPMQAEKWSAMSDIGAPVGRAYHTAVWTGSEMIVWGGNNNDGNGAPDSGGKYNPAYDSWKTISPINSPTYCTFHSAIWTGTEMITWGCYSNKKYNPDSDSWKSISTIGAPTDIFSCSVTWTGSEMIVWGGYNTDYSTFLLQNGAGYNPETDSWKSISTVGAPTGRRSHKAIWTGTEMIVYGGQIYVEATNSWPPTNTGGRYNPTTDTWEPISAPLNLNLPGNEPDIVWTGSEMVVMYGGETEIYNPIADTWKKVSSVNAPDPHSKNGIVWTGKEVIVWGGAWIDDGSSFNPSLNSWSTLTKVGAPSARGYLTEVWTGALIIVWGGVEAGGAYVNTGGLYTPP